MKKRIPVCLILAGMIALLGTSGFLNAESLVTSPNVVHSRHLRFYNEMTTRLVEYVKTLDWTLKVFPRDLGYLDHSDPTISVEIYVSPPKEAMVYSRDLDKPEEIKTAFMVYEATDEQVEELSQIPHSDLYKNEFGPVVCMQVDKLFLPQIAELPFVYCIRIIPNDVTAFSVTIDQARTYNDAEYVLNNHDSTVDQMDIAILDNGYHAADSWLGGVASDNIDTSTTWDYYYGDADVSDGVNRHGSICLDLIARTFGDTGDGDSMYNDPIIYHVKKICHTEYNEQGQLVTRWASYAQIRAAIEWCIQNDMEIVCMSWGFAWGLNPEYYCNSYWCDLFKQGVQAGVTWVAAAGNEGVNWGVSYPSESYFVVSVGGYESINGQNEAVRATFSNYGYGRYARYYGWLDVVCQECYEACVEHTGEYIEFKPNVYDAGVIDIPVYEDLVGTSIATPIVAACIALGIYSQPGEPNAENYNPGWQLVRDTVRLCNEWPVVPSYCSLQGDVTDTHTLWHRQVQQP